jgi:hypothetical protein
VDPKGPTPEAEWIAVDVSVRSRKSLTPLLEAWPWAQTPSRKAAEAPRWLHFGGSRAPALTADREVIALVRMVRGLSRAARRCWNEATSRTFDIGIQAGMSPYSFEGVELREETIEGVAQVGGRIKITLYAPRVHS